MPKRRNRFQNLVALIEKSLASDASVISPKLLMDSCGIQREIDILILSKIGQRNIRIGIECRDWQRKADVTWIDQIIGKYLDLHIDKKVAVSRLGFTQAALKRAKVFNIETLTLKEAKRAKWKSWMKMNTLLEEIVLLKVKEFGIVVDNENLSSKRPLLFYRSDNMEFIGDEKLIYREVFRRYLVSEYAFEMISKKGYNFKDESDTQVEFDIPPPSCGLTIKDANGILSKVIKIRPKVIYRKRQSPINPKRYNYSTSSLWHVPITVGGKRINAILSQVRDGPIKLTVGFEKYK